MKVPVDSVTAVCGDPKTRLDAFAIVSHNSVGELTATQYGKEREATEWWLELRVPLTQAEYNTLVRLTRPSAGLTAP